MFIYKNKLRHLLQPDHYRSQTQYERERDELFRPAWIPLAAKAELPNPGDFKTYDLLGEPVILHNNAGEILGYLNVCSHRHCLLTHALKGRMPKLRCQYHGWEYDREGKTNRIPDAKSFRPFDRENARLRTFATETLGDVVFVRLSNEGPTLREYLGPIHDDLAIGCGKPFKLAWRWESDYAANWKLPVENSLESYHMPCIHMGSLGDFPHEDVCTDLFRGHSTTFSTPMRPDSAKNWLMYLAKRHGVPATGCYTHHHVFPSLTFAPTDASKVLQVILPTGPTTCKHYAWLFTLRGANPLDWMLTFGTGLISKYMTRRVLTEDAPLFADTQKGLEASPYRGVIGVREERIYHFQEYLIKTLGQDPGPDPAEQAEAAAKARVRASSEMLSGEAAPHASAEGDGCSAGSSCEACDGSAAHNG